MIPPPHPAPPLPYGGLVHLPIRGVAQACALDVDALGPRCARVAAAPCLQLQRWLQSEVAVAARDVSLSTWV